MNLDVTFELGTNLDMAQVLVQNRVSVAEAKLPEEVKRIGVTTKKKSPSILLCVNLISPGQPLRPAVPEQLRVAERQGRPGPHQGRRRRGLPRAARLQHADLARPEQAGLAADDRQRRDPGDPGAERPGRRRPHRPAAGARRAERALPAADQHAGPPDQRGAVRGDHRQDAATKGQIVLPARRGRARRSTTTPGDVDREGHRTGGQELRRQQLPRRQAGGDAGRLPAARLQRPGQRPTRSAPRWRS